MKRFLILAAVVFAGISNADNTMKHEFTGGSSANLNFNNGTDITLSGGYHYNVWGPVQIGGNLALGYSKAKAAANGTTTLGLLVGPTLNIPFDMGFTNAFFVRALAGFIHTSVGGGGGSTTDFAFGGEAGKRFQIFSNVSYIPSVGVSKVRNQDVQFDVTPLAFSVLF